MSPPGKARQPRSASPEHDEDTDYKLALRLSEELNGDPSTPSYSGSAQQLDYDDDADFALALELQFGDSEGTYTGEQNAAVSNSGPSWRYDTPQAEVSPWGLRENEPNVANYHPETPGGQTFRTLVDFIQYVRAVRCPACKQTFFRSGLDVSMMLQNWKSSKAVLTSFLRCARCSTSFCIACTPQPSARWSVVSVQGKQVSWCCAGGRLFLLWLLLCGFDEHFSAAKLKELNHRKPDQQLQPEKNNNKKKSKQPERGGGVGFGGPARHPTPASAFMPNGKGYGSDMADYPSWGVGHTLGRHRFDPNAANINSKAKALSAQFTEDYFYGLHLQLIEGLLPSFERESSFDFDPPESLAEMLIESKILNYCTELLRNDSVEDATKRKNVYQALMSFLRTLGAHYITASSAIYNERPSREDKINLLVLSFQSHPGEASEKSSSLLNSLSNLNTQSELVLREAKSNEKEFGTPDGQNLLLLCRQISDLRQYLVANSGSYGEADSSQSKTEIPVLTDLPDVEVFASHAYATLARALQSPPAGRFKRLITEITTLKTGLPPGIFVRYAESRPDVQKIAIIGPVGTPYENGIFEFDFFCDADFPNKPPLVLFKTTGGGRVPFNPNLYADGKVCLSLLGTWQGEPWVPGESTLLQVVISIQAMILCEEPWYNEPGREASYQRSSGQSPAASYNQTIRQHTLRTAMLEWLDKTPSLWKDVIQQHFTANADKILHTAIEWSKSKVQPGYAGYSSFGNGLDDDYPPDLLTAPPMAGSRSSASHQGDLTLLLPRLQMALQKYGATQIIPNNFEPVARNLPNTHTKRALSQPGQPQPPPYSAVPPYDAPPPPPPPMPPYAPYFPTGLNPGHYGLEFGSFGGPGRALGGNEGQQSGENAINTTSGGYGGSSLGGPNERRGRYDISPPTRGGGASNLAANSSGVTGSSWGHFFANPASFANGHFGSLGRGGSSRNIGYGGRGELNGRGGRGGSRGSRSGHK